MDYTTDTGYVRLLLSDTDPMDPVFTDEAIAATLAREGGTKRAAAQLLDTIADNEALTSKAITSMDLRTDGPKVADSLRKRAAALRAQAQAEEDAAAADSAGFDVIPFRGGARRPEHTPSPTWPWGW